MKLVNKFRDVRKDRSTNTLMVYGTKGYGKSHLLAALVCYLAAKKERVLYIPDCKECVKEPVSYFKSAMLYTWADDETMQKFFKNLKTMDEILDFLNNQKHIIVVIDQMNALAASDGDSDDTRDAKKIWLGG